MKNIYFMASIATLLLAGCSKDDGAYKFENSETGAKAVINATIDKAGVATRMVDQTWSIGDEIGITCVDINLPEYDQKNFQYTLKDDQGAFTTVDPLKEIWFLGANDYQVTAYYPYSGEVGAVPKSLSNITNTENQLPENQQKIDYLFASTTASRNNPNVNLTFSHQMSRLVVQFESVKDEEDNPLIDLGTINCFLINVKQSGTFIPSTGIAVADDTDKAEDKNISQTLNKANGYKLSLILYPQSSTSTKIDAILKNSENPNGIYYAVDLGELLFKSGFSYNYTIMAKKDADNKIVLDVTKGSITAWDEVDNVEIESNPAPVQTNVGGISINEWSPEEEVSVDSKDAQ